jgi:hypothetical protein
MGVIWDLLKMPEWLFYIHYGKHMRRDRERDPFFNDRGDTRRRPRWQRKDKRWGDRFMWDLYHDPVVIRRKTRFREAVR